MKETLTTSTWKHINIGDICVHCGKCIYVDEDDFFHEDNVSD